ncbi:hypothetical protein H8D30_04435 [bacterium]|nr:hypothetical protein [bacterium]
MTSFSRYLFSLSLKSFLPSLYWGIICLIVVTFLVAILSPSLPEWGYGWPWHFLEVRGGEPDYLGSTFSWPALLLDLLFWSYVVIGFAFFKSRKVS